MKHGHSHTPTYTSWSHMKKRCNNPKYHQYKDYGGRGITYDPKWESFSQFLTDMGERPEGMTLDRFPDNNGNYCKDNCRWATRKEQRQTQRKPVNDNPLKRIVWDNSRGVWRSYSDKVNGKLTFLYYGNDFFEAVCRRRSYENHRVNK